jgi:putative PIN family toxin of toxin-antitoxin system
VIAVVIDPGVLVSAFISPTTAAPALLVEAVFDGRVTAVASQHLVDELAGVLGRPKFERHSADGRADAYIEALRERVTWIEDPQEVPRATEDPDDDYLVALAYAADVAAIVSGDRHLLALDSTDTPVWTPREAVR